MNCALIDLGSNTIRLSVYSTAEGNFTLLFSEKVTAGMFNYIDNKTLSYEGMIAAADVINGFNDILKHFAIDELRVFATASLRNIKNTEEACEKITRRTNIPIDVISGQEEAELSFLGALRVSNLDEGIMFDAGGGSTEIVHFKDNTVLSSQSLEIGCLSLYTNYVKKFWPKTEELSSLSHAIDAELEQIKNLAPHQNLLGIGGTGRAILKLCNSYYGSTNSSVISICKLREICDMLTSKTSEMRKLVLKKCPDRIHTIIPGTLLIKKIADKFCCENLYVSKYGVREGYLCKKLLETKT